MPTVQAIKNLAQFHEIINSGKIIFVGFSAIWCGPCRIISPIFEKYAEDAKGDVEFYKVDVDDVSDVAQECMINATPTFIAFKNGNKVGEFVGADPRRLGLLVNAFLQ